MPLPSTKRPCCSVGMPWAVSAASVALVSLTRKAMWWTPSPFVSRKSRQTLGVLSGSISSTTSWPVWKKASRAVASDGAPSTVVLALS